MNTWLYIASAVLLVWCALMAVAYAAYWQGRTDEARIHGDELRAEYAQKLEKLRAIDPRAAAEFDRRMWREPKRRFVNPEKP